MSYSELNSHSTPTEEIKNDPTIKALNSQLPPLRQAFSLMKQALEISEKVKMSMEALAPALEVQILGLNSELEQFSKNQDEIENAYASVVRKLEEQVRNQRVAFEERDQVIQMELSQLRQTVSYMNEELKKAIELTNIYQKLYHDLKDDQKKIRRIEEEAPTHLNLFHVFSAE